MVFMKLLFLVAILANACLAGADRAKENIENLKWMAGNWICELGKGTFEETWLPPNGGTMQGVGRHVIDGKTVFMEFLSIESDKDGGLTMYILLGAPSRGDKKPRAFKLTQLGKNVATFEWPENEFPSKIQYTMDRKGSLFCRISGKQQGKEAFEDYDFRARK
jgi:hypothetical protein